MMKLVHYFALWKIIVLKLSKLTLLARQFYRSSRRVRHRDRTKKKTQQDYDVTSSSSLLDDVRVICVVTLFDTQSVGTFLDSPFLAVSWTEPNTISLWRVGHGQSVTDSTAKYGAIECFYWTSFSTNVAMTRLPVKHRPMADCPDCQYCPVYCLGHFYYRFRCLKKFYMILRYVMNNSTKFHDDWSPSSTRRWIIITSNYM